MNDENGEQRELSGTNGGLRLIADNPDYDPCDVACDAMPGLVIGDLRKTDESWVREHTSECNYCREMLEGYEQVDDMLDAMGDEACPTCPPFVAPGTREVAWTIAESPIGPLLVGVSDKGLAEVGYLWQQDEDSILSELRHRGFSPVRDDEATSSAVKQLNEYFNGKRDDFEFDLDLSGLPPFTLAVLQATTKVPFGHMTTYKEIARKIGKPTSMRAVGNALGRNPIPVVVPCHRVMHSGGGLGGYSGGLPTKRQLLQREGVLLA